MFYFLSLSSFLIFSKWLNVVSHRKFLLFLFSVYYICFHCWRATGVDRCWAATPVRLGIVRESDPVVWLGHRRYPQHRQAQRQTAHHGIHLFQSLIRLTLESRNKSNRFEQVKMQVFNYIRKGDLRITTSIVNSLGFIAFFQARTIILECWTLKWEISRRFWTCVPATRITCIHCDTMKKFDQERSYPILVDWCDEMRSCRCWISRSKNHFSWFVVMHWRDRARKATPTSLRGNKEMQQNFFHPKEFHPYFRFSCSLQRTSTMTMRWISRIDKGG